MNTSGCGSIGWLICASLWVACASQQTHKVQPIQTEKNLLSAEDFYVSPNSYDFSLNPKLLQRILSGPHGYFRFINIAFANATCKRFSALLSQMPTVNLHGDAHLEQYAITDRGRGLTDFDDSTIGPGIIDLIRFAVSIHLACQERNMPDKAKSLIATFLDGYQQALAKPGQNAPKPHIVKEIQARFHLDQVKYFSWVESLMDQDASVHISFQKSFQTYVEAMRQANPSLPAHYFTIKKMGAHHIGIGSALDEKYLVRIEGLTVEAQDDVVLEAKEVRDISGIPCIRGAKSKDPFRIMIAQARISYRPYDHIGYLRFRGKNFWVHAWVHNYKELRINQADLNFEAIRDIAFDVGVQLGRGHPHQIAAPLDQQLRRAQLDVLQTQKNQLYQAAKEFADLTRAAWERFRDQYNQTPMQTNP